MRFRVKPLAVTLAIMIFFMLWAPGVQAQHKVAFITSVSGNGNLGDPAQWPDNGGFTGSAAADRVCQNRAEAANLPNSGDFVAWLSTSVDDAYCRVHDLSGKKITNCGQSGLPAWAGPWVRVDGAPFAETIDEALMPSGLVYRYVGLDEFGADVGAYTSYFTGTDEFGVQANQACSDWTTTGGTGGVGQNSGTTTKWTSAGYQDCDSQRPLLCLEANGAGPPLSFSPQAGAGVFVTSVGGTGDLGSWPEAGSAEGLAAGDAICRTLAENAGLHAPESYVAWLSDASEDARDRVTGNGPWIRPDKVMVAADKTDLTDNLILSSIHVTETVDYVQDFVFTGTMSQGYGTSDHCGNWTNGTSGYGDYGVTVYGHHSWTAYGTQLCSEQYRLYCFSNSNSWPYFSDGFESGDLRWWSAAQSN